MYRGGGRTLKDKSDKKFTFFEKTSKVGVCRKIKKNKKAFSVAEAMITLLIVSVALAAMAPLFSKKTAPTSGGSKWLFTRSGSDITRPGGNVGIGVPTFLNPDAKFEVRGNDGLVVSIKADSASGSDIIRIEKGGNIIGRMDHNGVFMINQPVDLYNTSIDERWNPLTTYDGSIGRNALLRKGGLSINSATPHKILTVYDNDSGRETAWINSDGSSSFGGVPSGMYAFFDRPCSHIPGGWEELPDFWKGRFPRIAGTFEVCDKNGLNCANHTLNYADYQNDAIRNIEGGFNADIVADGRQSFWGGFF